MTLIERRIADAKTYRIAGTHLTDGYQTTRRALDIVVTPDGSIYDAELLDLRMVPIEEALLTLGDDGDLTGWGSGESFSPDAGEMTRVYNRMRLTHD